MIKAFDDSLICDCLQAGCPYCDRDGSRNKELKDIFSAANEKITEEEAFNLRNMEVHSMLNWWTLRSYLRKEFQEGKTEFRISFLGDKEIYIHPLGKDGETIDLKL